MISKIEAVLSSLFVAITCLLMINQAANGKSESISADVVLPLSWISSNRPPCSSSIGALFSNCGDIQNPLALSYKAAHSEERLADSVWSTWELTLDEDVNNEFAKQMSTDVGGKLLVSRVSYGVTSNGEITNVQYYPPQNNSEFESKIRKVLTHLPKAHLKFPSEANVDYVQRDGRFIQNYGANIIERRKRGNLR